VRQRALASAALLVCLLWGIAAVGKLRDPLAAYELIALNVGPGALARAMLAAIVAAETLLAVWIALGLSAARGLAVSLGALAGLTVVLLVAQERVGGAVPCGCLPSGLDSTVEDAIVRNLVLMGVVAALLVWDWRARVTDRDGAAASGPSTPAP
jgi:methylamine utilization protein MauE